MKILVTGYNGQLGFDVVKEGRNRGFNMVGTTKEDLDICSEEEVFNYITRVNPHAIIHCAAYTAVDKAEENRNECFNVNVLGTTYLAKAAKSIKAKFMYISTDYVFQGNGTIPFQEIDEPKPSGFYGLTKYQGERVVQSILEEWFIIRISWVFGINGNNFVKTMLRLAETNKELNVVSDQIGSPTYTLDLARLLIDFIQSNKYGIYHASNEGFCSWAEFAKEIFTQTNKNIKVNSILTQDYPTKAVRPKNSRLSKEKVKANGFIPLLSWQEALTHYLNTLKEEVK